MPRLYPLRNCLIWTVLSCLWLPLGAQQKGEITMSAHALTQAMLAGNGTQVALVFDDLNTAPASMEWAKRAAADYVTAAPAGTRWAVITTSGVVKQPFTSDAATVKAVLAKLSSHAEAVDPTSASQITGLTEKMHGGGNADESLQNQSAHSLDELGAALSYAAAQPGGPTTVILASNGFPTDFPANGTNLNQQMEQLNTAARNTGLVVNAIDPAAIDPSLTSVQWQLQEVVMSGLAQATGGKLVDNRNALAHAYGDVAADPVQAEVQTKLRDSFNGKKFDELPIEVIPQRWQPEKGASTGSRLVVLISPKGIKFTDDHGRHRQHFRVAAVLSNAQGQWVVAREGDIQLNVTDKTLEKLNHDGIQAAIALPAPPGAYHVVIVAQDLQSGATTSLAANLAIK